MKSNAFLTTLQKHRAGQALDDASELMAKAVLEARETGKPATVTIAVTVRPASRFKGAMTVTAAAAIKSPKREQEESFWFATNDGQLVKDNPDQKEFGFTPETVQVTGDTPEEVTPPASAVAVNG